MKDLTGMKIGILTIVSLADRRGTTGQKYWNCLCECGNYITRREDAVKLITSCGCLTGRIMSDGRRGKRIDKSLVGKRFGKLVALEYVRDEKRGITWICKCDCGNTKTIRAHSLKSGATKSCGCLYILGDEYVAARSLYSSYIKSAKARGFTFDLTKDEFDFITHQDCAYCGASPSNYRKNRLGGVQYSGVDRVDNTLGYTTSNCLPCCATCNMAKNKTPLSDFLGWIDRVSKFTKNSKVISEFMDKHK